MNEREEVLLCKNGINIYHYKNPSLHSFYISLFVKAGCMYEREEQYGITHFLEHALIRNVNKLYDMKLYSILDKRGIEFNAGTYSEMIQFYVSGADFNFREGADILSKLFSPIILTKSEVDSERRRIKAEIRETNDKTTLASFTGRAVFEDTPLASSIVGTNKSVDKMTVAALERYRREALSAKNVFFYISGNFTDEDLKYLKTLSESLDIDDGVARENIAPIPANFGDRQTIVHIKNAEYTKVRFTFDLDMTKYSVAETDLLYDMLLSGYNSKLFIELSEKRGLFYDISGASERYRNIGTLNFTYEIKERDLYDAISLTVDILNSLKTPEGAESEFIKAGYVDNAYLLYDDARELNFTFAYDNHIMSEGYRSVEERRERYERIDSARLCEMAREIFLPKNLTLTMKANKKKVDEEKIKEAVLKLL